MVRALIDHPHPEAPESPAHGQVAVEDALGSALAEHVNQLSLCPLAALVPLLSGGLPGYLPIHAGSGRSGQLVSLESKLLPRLQNRGARRPTAPLSGMRGQNIHSGSMAQG